MNLSLALRSLTQLGSVDSAAQQDAHGLLELGLNMIIVLGYFFELNVTVLAMYLCPMYF